MIAAIVKVDIYIENSEQYYEGSKGFQKIILENDFHTKNARTLCIFRCKMIILSHRKNRSF